MDGSVEVPCFEMDRDTLEAPEVIPVQLMCPAFERFCHINHHSSELPPAAFVDSALQVRIMLCPSACRVLVITIRLLVVA